MLTNGLTAIRHLIGSQYLGLSVCLDCGKPLVNHHFLMSESRRQLVLDQRVCSSCLGRWHLFDPQNARRQMKTVGSRALSGYCRHPRLMDSYCISVAPYVDPFKRYISRLKFYDGTVYAPVLGDILWFGLRLHLSWLKTQFEDDALVICPMPLHHRRLMERGYNQSELLAERLLKHLNRLGYEWQFMPQYLKRIRQTCRQSELSSWSDRFANLEQAFLADRAVTGKVILLVDDVVTSSATLRSAMLTLYEQGAAEVLALTVCRA